MHNNNNNIKFFSDFYIFTACGILGYIMVVRVSNYITIIIFLNIVYIYIYIYIYMCICNNFYNNIIS